MNRMTRGAPNERHPGPHPWWPSKSVWGSLVPRPDHPWRRAGWRPTAAISLLAGLALGCGSDDTPTRPSPDPGTPAAQIENLAVAPNPNNVLSGLVTFDVTGADSARVVYHTDNGPSGATPFTDSLAEAHVAILGLRPTTTYDVFVEARTGNATVTSDTVQFTTDSLPEFLANTHLTSSAPSSGGYILTSVGDGNTSYAVAFDSTGQLSWYRGFSEGVPAGEIKQQENGDITMFLGATHGGEPVPGRYVELSPDGSIVRTFTAPDGAYTDNHEFWLLFQDGEYDGALFDTYTQRHIDLSDKGGPSDSVASGHQIVRVAADGSQRVVFDAWDHFDFSQNVEPIGGEADYDHPNAISVDADGNYVVSWRNLDAITKIDANTGDILWTLASPWSGVQSDFEIVGDPLGGFSAQHSVRVVGDNDIIIFDNGTRHSPAASRAVEYHLDPSAKTATMTWQYQHNPPFYTEFTGSVQRLSNGNTLIGWTWGNPLVATEVTQGGTVAWEGTLTSPGMGAPYRFTKIVSLYRYERP